MAVEHSKQGQLTTSYGLGTTVLSGCLESIVKAHKEIKYDLVVFIWDKGASWRKAINTSYKDERKKNLEEGTQDRVAQQIESAQVMLDQLRVPQFYVKGLEGDDCLGLLAHYFIQDPNNFVTLLSSDQDLYQLLDDRIAVYDAKAGKYHTNESFRAQYDIEPEQWTSVKALAGKPGEVPGVHGVGKTTAQKIIKICGDARGITKAHLDQLSPSKAKLFDNISEEELTLWWNLSYILRHPDELGGYREAYDDRLNDLNAAIGIRELAEPYVVEVFRRYELEGKISRVRAICAALKVSVI